MTDTLVPLLNMTELFKVVNTLIMNVYRFMQRRRLDHSFIYSFIDSVQSYLTSCSDFRTSDSKEIGAINNEVS